MSIHYLHEQGISSDQFSEIRDLLDDPCQHHTECVGESDPDDGIKEGKAVEVDQKTRERMMCVRFLVISSKSITPKEIPPRKTMRRDHESET